jgi:hypothetical protein
MPTTDLLPVAFAAAVVYGAYSVIYNAYFHPLARFPGPRLAGITTYWKAYIECILKKSFCDELRELHAIYGTMTLHLLRRRMLILMFCSRVKATSFV